MAAPARATTSAERLVQPLAPWLWATTLPLRLAERSPRPSLAAATGQFLVLTGRGYRRAGGHAAVRGEVIEDIALLRAVKRAGGRGGPVDGSRLAACRMYDGWAELRDGYTKSLWGAVGGSPAASAAAAAALTAVWVLPPVAALRGSRAGLAGYAAGVAGRALVAAAHGQPGVARRAGPSRLGARPRRPVARSIIGTAARHPDLARPGGRPAAIAADERRWQRDLPRSRRPRPLRPRGDGAATPSTG